MEINAGDITLSKKNCEFLLYNWRLMTIATQAVVCACPLDKKLNKRQADTQHPRTPWQNSVQIYIYAEQYLNDIIDIRFYRKFKWFRNILQEDNASV